MATVLITGSSKGLGKALALVFSKNGYNIILHGKDEGDKENLEEIKEQILKNNVQCDAVSGDLTLNESIEKISRLALEKDISILINNAGINYPESFENLDIKELEKVINVNLIAPIKLTKKIYPLFLQKKSGTIININSVAGLKVQGEGRTSYSTSKFGLRAFTEALRNESKKHNIRIIGVYPEGMNTDGYLGKFDKEKCMKPEEVAEIIYKVCEDYSSSGIDDIKIGRRNLD